MTLFLGVDGGGTGCRAVVADASGRRLGEGRAGAANIVTDLDGACANILTATQMALGARTEMATLHAVLGLAGANVPGYAQRLTAALPFATTVIASDAVTALRGALHDEDGVAAMLGTGSVFASQHCGQVTVTGGWGFVLGDEGGGAWLGRNLLGTALQAQDGLVAMTPLLAEVIREAGGAHGLVEFARTARPGDFARYAPRIVAASGDAAAEYLLRTADGWITREIDHLAAGRADPVTFLGGLGPIFADRLAARYGSRLRKPLGTGLDGALWMALQEARHA